jgi:Replicative DNA helicase
MTDPVSEFYRRQLPEAHQRNGSLQAPCPFCIRQGKQQASVLSVHLNPDSFFHGYFHCLNHCVPGGFSLHFARTGAISPAEVPGYDPDRDYFGHEVDYPAANLNHELAGFTEKLTGESLDFFRQVSIAPEVLHELRIGYNGRYLVYPYIQANRNCYVARCVHPERPEDFFWHGDERFAAEQFRLFNIPEIEHCENGSLFLVEGEHNLLPLKQLGLPGIAVPVASDLEHLDPQWLRWIRAIFLWVNHSAESEAMARNFATRTGYKVRLVRWPEQAARNSTIFQLAATSGPQFRREVLTFIKQARAFSPFATPTGEFQAFRERLIQESGASYADLTGGFAKMDRALDGIHGINIMGGTPKAGKSAFFIQIASDMALRKIPVLYYDFENGRQKIYLRILSRLSRLAIDQIKQPSLPADDRQRLAEAERMLRTTLNWLRVINDRRLTPEIMRRHIDFLRHETNSDYTVVVIDSLHKLPFKDISQQRSGIDGWLRQLEAIRDDLGAAFLVISELERNLDGQFDHQPHLGSFKGSGDIGYSADNAMVFLTLWDPFADASPQDRRNDLWLVASREQSPGRIASYQLDYPYWGFKEED